MEIKDVTVIGAGLIGSAAARHLAENGLSVTLIGAVQGNEDGVHASHYDEARVTRYIGPDVVWSDLAAASISRYADIEARAGIKFHTPCGHLRCDLPNDHPESVLASVQAVRNHLKNDGWEIPRHDIETRFPFLSFQKHAVFHWDSGPAGIINPRRLIEAQIVLASRSGANMVQGVCTRIERQGHSFIVHDSLGNKYLSANVLICTGAYTNRFPLTPKPLKLEVRPETVVLMEVSEELQTRLAQMPGIIWNFDHLPRASSVYVLPPVKYPNKRIYVKIGADYDRNVQVNTLSEMHAYMTSNGSVRTKHLLIPILRALIPELAAAPVISKPCLLTYTPGGYPIIDELEKGWYVAAGGCGKSAKSSDQIGKLAADLIQKARWGTFNPSTFAAPG
ncbi:MAG: NAD(P)/FAD-dependent oxidoreductase [Rhodothermales bacterium]